MKRPDEALVGSRICQKQHYGDRFPNARRAGCRGVEDNATNTVETHVRELCRKLGTTSQAEAWPAGARSAGTRSITRVILGPHWPTLGRRRARFGSDIA